MWVLGLFLQPGDKEWGRGLASHLLIGGAMCTGQEKSKANTSPLYGDLGQKGRQAILLRRVPKLLNSYNVAWGQGESDRIWFSLFLHSKTLLIHLVLSSLGHHNLYTCLTLFDLYLFLHDCPLFTKPRKKNKDSSLTASSGLCFLMKFPMLRKIYNKYICVLSS